jgi:hypothetical protein
MGIAPKIKEVDDGDGRLHSTWADPQVLNNDRFPKKVIALALDAKRHCRTGKVVVAWIGRISETDWQMTV